MVSDLRKERTRLPASMTAAVGLDSITRAVLTESHPQIDQDARCLILQGSPKVRKAAIGRAAARHYQHSPRFPCFPPVPAPSPSACRRHRWPATLPRQTCPLWPMRPGASCPSGEDKLLHGSGIGKELTSTGRLCPMRHDRRLD